MGMQLYAGTQPPSSHRRDNRHGNYNRYSQSTAFIPAAWDFANNRRGLVGLITQICTDIDNRVCPSAVSVVDDPNSVFDRSARGERSLPQGAYARVNTNPAYVRCPKCKRQVRTRISREIGTTSIVATAAAAAVVVAVNAPAAAYPLVALPLQLKMFKRKVHTCPECHFKMGRNVTIHIPE
ncbi:hypothetical protein FBU59_005519 [Linderina macrospora]|uniref:Uncharacterized protein n=1 Tax=Linderina macrospora TaxID=4868 RepID=A0ACC1J2B5_9FUNG|nr:hypothetical protein FBU59_005519 [Linderina macrospora]